jgi:hypothetical protein
LWHLRHLQVIDLAGAGLKQYVPQVLPRAGYIAKLCALTHRSALSQLSHPSPPLSALSALSRPCACLQVMAVLSLALGSAAAPMQCTALTAMRRFVARLASIAPRHLCQVANQMVVLVLPHLGESDAAAADAEGAHEVR